MTPSNQHSAEHTHAWVAIGIERYLCVECKATGHDARGNSDYGHIIVDTQPAPVSTITDREKERLIDSWRRADTEEQILRAGNDMADALALPTVPLVSTREAIAQFLDEYEHVIFEGREVVIIDPEETTEYLFASGILKPSNEVEAAAREAGYKSGIEAGDYHEGFEEGFKAGRESKQHTDRETLARIMADAILAAPSLSLAAARDEGDADHNVRVVFYVREDEMVYDHEDALVVGKVASQGLLALSKAGGRLDAFTIKAHPGVGCVVLNIESPRLDSDVTAARVRSGKDE